MEERSKDKIWTIEDKRGLYILPTTDWSFEHGTTYFLILVKEPGSAAQTLRQTMRHGPRQAPPHPLSPGMELMPSRKRYKLRVEYWPGKLRESSWKEDTRSPFIRHTNGNLTP